MTSVDEVQPVWSTRLKDYPTTMKASPDGLHLAVGSGCGQLDLLRLEDGELVASNQAHRDGVLSVSWHPQRQMLASGGQEPVLRLWNAPRLTPSGSIEAMEGWVDHVAFSPAGGMLAVAAGKRVYIRDLEFNETAVSPEHAASVTGLAWRPDGSHVVTATYGAIQQLQGETATVRRQWRWKGSMLGLSLSPDGRTAACGCQDNSVHFWRLANGSNAAMSGYPAKPSRLSWRADGQLLATNGSTDVVVWSFAGKGPEGTAAELLTGHEDLVSAVAFAPQGGGLASGGKDARVLFWMPGRTREPVAVGNMESRVEEVLWSFRGEQVRICAADASGLIRCWEL
jgi:WD40 repeat protein